MSQATSQKGQWTKAALEAKAEKKKKHQDLLAEAVAWCEANGLRGGKAIKQEQFAGKLTVRQINYAIDNPVIVRNKYDVLTAKELERLKDWIRACEAKNAPATNADISKKVREFLVARALFNRKHPKNPNLEYLTKHEWDIVRGKTEAAFCSRMAWQRAAVALGTMYSGQPRPQSRHSRTAIPRGGR